MAIVSVKEIPRGTSGDSAVGKTSVRKHVRCFLVITNSVYDGDYEVQRAFGIPRPGQRHPSDTYAFANHAKADREGKGKFAWVVSVDYTTERQRDENPFADPAVIEWNTDTTQETFAYDVNVDAILNAAGDPYEEQVKDDVSYWTVTITKNLPYVPLWINSYRDAVNSDNVYIDGVPITAGMAKIKSIKISKWQTRGDYQYRELNLTIKIKDDWQKHLLENGLTQIVTVDGTSYRFACANDDGTHATKPKCLAADGSQISWPTPATAVFTDWDIRNTQPFYALPLN